MGLGHRGLHHRLCGLRNSERRPWRPDRAAPRADPHRTVVVRIHGGYGPGPHVPGPATRAISVRRRRSGIISQLRTDDLTVDAGARASALPQCALGSNGSRRNRYSSDRGCDPEALWMASVLLAFRFVRHPLECCLAELVPRPAVRKSRRSAGRNQTDRRRRRRPGTAAHHGQGCCATATCCCSC